MAYMAVCICLCNAASANCASVMPFLREIMSLGLGAGILYALHCSLNDHHQQHQMLQSIIYFQIIYYIIVGVGVFCSPQHRMCECDIVSKSHCCVCMYGTQYEVWWLTLWRAAVDHDYYHYSYIYIAIPFHLMERKLCVPENVSLLLSERKRQKQVYVYLGLWHTHKIRHTVNIIWLDRVALSDLMR